MKCTTKLNNLGKMASVTDRDTYRDRGVTEIGFVTPGNTQSHQVTPSHGNFFPLFSAQFFNRVAVVDGSRGIHPTEYRDQKTIRRVATIEPGLPIDGGGIR